MGSWSNQPDNEHLKIGHWGEGNGNPLQCSCLENPRDGRAWWAAIYGVVQSWTWLKRLSSSNSSIMPVIDIPSLCPSPTGRIIAKKKKKKEIKLATERPELLIKSGDIRQSDWEKLFSPPHYDKAIYTHTNTHTHTHTHTHTWNVI